MSEFLSTHSYASYATRNVQMYLDVIEAAAGPQVLALSSGFMTYDTGVHPEYPRLHREIATSVTTLVLLPSLDYETCVTERSVVNVPARLLGRPRAKRKSSAGVLASIAIFPRRSSRR